jgi:hypothetical protein
MSELTNQELTTRTTTTTTPVVHGMKDRSTLSANESNDSIAKELQLLRQEVSRVVDLLNTLVNNLYRIAAISAALYIVFNSILK